MKKIVCILTLCVICFFGYCREKPQVTFFYSPHCKSCLEVKAEILNLVKEQYKGIFQWKELNTFGNPDNLSLLTSVSAQFNKKKALVPAILAGDMLLVGKQEIKDDIGETLEDLLISSNKPFNFSRIKLLDVFNRMSVFAIIGSGLADGINPCAFAVIIFFISFLSAYGYRKKEIICIGTAYCLAVFITYFLIGLGFFKFLYLLGGAYSVIKVFYYFVAGFCFLMALGSLYDYYRFKKTKSSQGFILQLPKFIKKKINLIIGSNLRQRREKSAIRLIAISFIVGVTVSLLEAVCTGQVYVPVIVFILKNTSLKLKAFIYLAVYNLMFIFPLVIIFLFSLFGVKSKKFNDFLKHNVGKIKIIMALVFLILGVFILYLG